MTIKDVPERLFYRCNGTRFECYFREAEALDAHGRTGQLAVHDKSDGCLLASTQWRQRGQMVSIEWHVHPQLEAVIVSAMRELFPLWGQVFRRCILRTRMHRIRVSEQVGRKSDYFSTRLKVLEKKRYVRTKIPEDYASIYGLLPQKEEKVLCFAGLDFSGREVWLEASAKYALMQMRAAAQSQGVCIQLVSGFRSAAYQERILQRKLEAGHSMGDILKVNAAPGYSEHHTGRALDLGAEGCPPAEVQFEQTSVFDWLVQHAWKFGFRMSYPRENRHGIAYEPWHWFFQGLPYFRSERPPA
jgi:LAS superfamily LD-carboxypeptidase LdcB